MHTLSTTEITQVSNGFIVTFAIYGSETKVFPTLAEALSWVAQKIQGNASYRVALTAG